MVTIVSRKVSEWFHAIIGRATVECYSGGKSIHHDCIYQKALTHEEEKELIELKKKAFPFADFGVLSDRARLCRVPGAMRDNGKLQSIEYIGDRLDILEILKGLREKTAHIISVVSVTKSFLKALYPEGGKITQFNEANIVAGYNQVRDIKRKGEVSQTTNHVPGLHESLVEMLQSGYPLTSDSFESRGLKENSLIAPVLDQEIEKAKKEIEDRVYKGATEEIKKIKPVPKMKEGSWRWQTMKALEGKWRAFYEEQGIREIEASSDRTLRGYTPGEHHNKSKGFVFREDNGLFCNYYGDQKGNGVTFLETVIGMSREEAWKELAKYAGVETVDKCKYCEISIEWQDKKPLNLDGTPHKCQKVEKKESKEKEKTQRPTTQNYMNWFEQNNYKFAINDMNDDILIQGTLMTDLMLDVIKAKARDEIKKVNIAHLKESISVSANQKHIHPIKDYLASLPPWDGHDYIKDITDHFTSEFSYFTIWFRHWICGAIARVYEHYQNEMLVLAGAQDLGKSTFAKYICPLPDLFIESPIIPEQKDCKLRLIDTFIWEVSELGATTKKADVEALKGFLTLEKIRERKSYGHFDVQKPTVSSFIGTINKDAGFLYDRTGSRRFLICELTKIDWDYIKIDKDKVWAQALALYKEGNWKLTKEQKQERDSNNQLFIAEDPIEDFILENYDIDSKNHDWFTATTSILAFLKDQGINITPGTSRQIASILNAQGCLKIQKRTVTGILRGYQGIQKR